MLMQLQLLHLRPLLGAPKISDSSYILHVGKSVTSELHER